MLVWNVQEPFVARAVVSHQRMSIWPERESEQIEGAQSTCEASLLRHDAVGYSRPTCGVAAGTLSDRRLSAGRLCCLENLVRPMRALLPYATVDIVMQVLDFDLVFCERKRVYVADRHDSAQHAIIIDDWDLTHPMSFHNDTRLL